MHTTRCFLLLLLGVGLCCAQPPLAKPHIGYVMDRQGSLRRLYGTAGNFILGEVLSAENISFAGSAIGALVKTPTEVIWLAAGGEVNNCWPAPPGEAQFAFEPAGSGAFVFFPEKPVLMHIAGGRLEAVPLDIERLAGSVVAMAAPGQGVAELAVRRGDETWLVTVSPESGEIIDERLLAGVSGPVHLLDGGVLYSGRSELVWRSRRGIEKTFPLDAAIEWFATLGAGWVAVSAKADGAAVSTLYGLRLEEGREGIYQLPEVAP